MHLLPTLVLLVLSTSLAIPAYAAAGRLEISQTCAVAAGCFSGDAPGFPVTIDGSAGQSYVLTSDLSVTDPAVNGITVTAEGVRIDLNGFQIAGPITCTGTGPTLICDPGTGRGIDASATIATEVVHGSVTGFGDDGVHVRTRSRVDRILALENGDDGIEIFTYSRVTASIALRNGDRGILSSSRSIVEHCIARGNGNAGLTGGGTAQENLSSGNGGIGFSGWSFGVLRNNVAILNSSDGFVAFVGQAQISGNVAYQNGGSGFVAGSDSSLQRNASNSNSGWGLELNAADVFYRENSINNNAAGTVLGGTSAARNVCDGVSGCP